LPTYEYACTACGHRLEAVQSFADDPLTTCPECGGALRKVYGAVGIVLKGSGFYKTDSRAASSAAAKAGGDKASSGDTAGADAGAKKETKEPTSNGSGSGSGSGDSSSSSSGGSGKDAAPAASTSAG